MNENIYNYNINKGIENKYQVSIYTLLKDGSCH